MQQIAATLGGPLCQASGRPPSFAILPTFCQNCPHRAGWAWMSPDYKFAPAPAD
jgi:hypothetical protein